MLDRKFIVDNIAAVQQNCKNRGVDIDVAKLAELDEKRRETLNEAQELNRRANEVSKSIGKASADERQGIIEEGRKLREQKDAAQSEHDRLDAAMSRSPQFNPASSPRRMPVWATRWSAG